MRSGSSNSPVPAPPELTDRLSRGGLRVTPQREHVYRVLLDKRDHPTAEEVFLRSKQDRPEISIATVYNCLDALVKCGLVRQVNLDRTATRYCPNMKQHCHFYCDACGRVYDVDLAAKPRVQEARVPIGFEVDHFEVSIRGRCPECRDADAS